VPAGVEQAAARGVTDRLDPRAGHWER
jgi:hypothetical protein